MCLDLLYHKKKKIINKNCTQVRKSVRKIKIHLAKQNALFKELVDSPQKRTEKTEEVSMIFL